MDAVNRSFRRAHSAVLVCAAMIAFACNSLLCRLALAYGRIDAATFASIRLASGAAILVALANAQTARSTGAPPDRIASTALCFFVVMFSFAYGSVSVNTGALILFGAVQLTIFGACLIGGEHVGPVEWCGSLLALAGLLCLILPGAAAPMPEGAAQMTAAGVCWGVCTLRGQRIDTPLAATARDFLRAAPLSIVVGLLFHGRLHATPAGVALAALSGAVTSGAAFAAWYAALTGLSAMRAAVVQLSVPPLATLGAVLFLTERLSLRMAVVSAAMLSGMAVVLVNRAKPMPPRRGT